MKNRPNDKVIRDRRESHVAIMLIGLLMTVLLAAAVVVALQNLTMLGAVAPTESPAETGQALPTMR